MKIIKKFLIKPKMDIKSYFVITGLYMLLYCREKTVESFLYDVQMTGYDDLVQIVIKPMFF